MTQGQATESGELHTPSNLWGLAAALVVAASALVAFRPVAGWDIWWHLRTGQQILETGTWIGEDPFSHTYGGQPWRYKDGVADIVLWLFWRAGGTFGLFLFRCLLVSVVGMCLIAVASTRSRSPVPGLLAFALFLVGSQNQLIVRPSLFTVAALASLLAITHRADRSDSKPRALFFAIALVSWAGMLLHRGGVFLVIVSIGFALWTVVGGMLPRGKLGGMLPRSASSDRAGSPVIYATISAIASICAGLLTPNGTALYATTFDVTGNEALRESISEWSPLTREVLLESFMAIPVVVAIALACWVFALLLSEREERPSFWLPGVVLVTTWMALNAVRHIPFLALSCAMLLADTLPLLTRRIRARSGLLLVAASSAVLTLPAINRVGEYTLELPPARYPVGAMEFARQNELGERVHHAFVFGGWVIWDGWPEHRALIDGRNDMVYPVEFYLRCSHAQTDASVFAELEDEFPADWVLADNTAGRVSHGFLATDPEWMLVYWDAVAAVYVRGSDHPELNGEAYRFLFPPDPVASFGAAIQASGGDPANLGLIEGELIRMREMAPEDVRPLSLQVLFYDAVGAIPQREMAWNELVRIAPDHPVVEQLRERIDW